MDAAHQYAAHLLGLFLLTGAMNATEAVHPVVWIGALALVAIPVLSDLDDLGWGRR